MSDSPIFDLAGQRVWIAGHTGMVGSALVRRLRDEACTPLLITRSACDLRRQEDVLGWVKASAPDVVIIAAARVGGILANSTYPADFIYDNLAIATNVLHACFCAGVRKVLLLGSSCVYPKFAPQPIDEEALLTGPLEATNEWYAVAKIAGIKLCQAYRRQHRVDFTSCMPCNLYGPGDNFDPLHAHVIPALLQKMHQAKIERARSIEVWGSGTPHREFLHVDDLADACIYLLRHYSGELPINVGMGIDLPIRDLAALIKAVVGYTGELHFNAEMPDGTPQKLLDVSRLTALGWRPRIDLHTGLTQTYAWYTAQRAEDAAGRWSHASKANA